jgi:hypothetical protein
MITGAVPYTSYDERVLLVQQLRQEFENKVRINYNDNDGLVYYEHYDNRRRN